MGHPSSNHEEKSVMTDVLIVFVTVGHMDEALKIGRTLVEERQVACANIVPQIHSVYRWKGEVCNNQECLVIMKTESSLFPSLQGRIRQLHSYEVPEIIAFPVTRGLPEYLEWVVQNTGAETVPQEES
jgi:periplasmic divalent cation tolerance protein